MKAWLSATWHGECVRVECYETASPRKATAFMEPSLGAKDGFAALFSSSCCDTRLGMLEGEGTGAKRIDGAL